METEENAGRGDEEPPAPPRREGSKKAKEIPESAIELTSIGDLRKAILIKEHQGIFPRVIFLAASRF